MLCFSISEQEIEIALDNTKAAFRNSTAVADEPANLEQCVKALKIAADRLIKIKKDGKRALNKDQNLNLRKAVEEAYMELTQLQVYFGPDKAQKCFQIAGKWRGVVNIPEPIQPQLRPPVHESRRSVDSASISSGGTHSIPDQFYQADMASRSGEIDIHEEENSVGNTPGSSKVDLDVFRIDEPDEDRRKPREQYIKHTGCFADAAPRMEHSTGNVDEGLLGTTNTGVESDREDPEASESPSAAPPQDTPTSPIFENNGQSEISEARNIQVIAQAKALYDFPGKDENYLAFKVGDIINVIEYLNDEWWRGTLRNDVGIFPTAYVQPLEPPTNGTYPTITLQRVAEPLTGGDLSPPGEGQLAGLQGNALRQPLSIQIPGPSDRGRVSTPPPPAPSSVVPAWIQSPEASGVRNVPVIARAQASLDFPVGDEHYLPFKVGDIINVVEFVNDGWWRGTLGRDVGIFPTAYVHLL
ncbi:SH3-domain kinase binding protein 1 [Mortierella sp. NVP85]|nr:SH3-domain kinase binding protein 1 [Mortierella sp. NVP85]